MAVCARAIQQPDGVWLLALDPAQTNLAACAYVVDTGMDSGWNELGQLSIADASVISGGIALLWAAAWGIRQLILMVQTSDKGEIHE